MRFYFLTVIFSILFITHFYGQQSILIADSGLNNLSIYNTNGDFVSVIDDDINTPRGVTNDENMVFYINRDNGQVRSYNMNTGELNIIAEQLDNPFDIYALVDLDVLVITENGGKVSKMNYDGSDYVVVTDIIQSPLFLSYDHIEEKIFVTNRDAIFSMNLDGSNIDIVSVQFDEVIAIEVDPRSKEIYFSDRGNVMELAKMNYDGTNRRVILNSQILFAYLDLDCDSDKLYFSTGGAGGNLCGVFNLDGSNLEIFDTGIDQIAGLDLVINYCENITNTDENIGVVLSTVFPNPTYGYVEVNNNSGFKNLEVFNLDGVKLSDIDLVDGKNSVYLENSGVYFFKLNSNNQSKIERVIRI